MEIKGLVVLAAYIKTALALTCYTCKPMFYEKINGQSMDDADEHCESQDRWYRHNCTDDEVCATSYLKGYGVRTELSRGCYAKRKAGDTPMGTCRAQYGDFNGVTYVDCFCTSDLCNNATELPDLVDKNPPEQAGNYAKCYACALDDDVGKLGARGSKECFGVQKGLQFECQASKELGCVDTILTDTTFINTDTIVNRTCASSVMWGDKTTKAGCTSSFQYPYNITKCVCYGEFCNAVVRPRRWWEEETTTTSTSATTSGNSVTTKKIGSPQFATAATSTPGTMPIQCFLVAVISFGFQFI